MQDLISWFIRRNRKSQAKLAKLEGPQQQIAAELRELTQKLALHY